MKSSHFIFGNSLKRRRKLSPECLQLRPESISKSFRIDASSRRPPFAVHFSSPPLSTWLFFCKIAHGCDYTSQTANGKGFAVDGTARRVETRARILSLRNWFNNSEKTFNWKVPGSVETSSFFDYANVGKWRKTPKILWKNYQFMYFFVGCFNRSEVSCSI